MQFQFLAARYDSHICHTGSPGYMGWLNRFYKYGLSTKCFPSNRIRIHNTTHKQLSSSSDADL